MIGKQSFLSKLLQSRWWIVIKIIFSALLVIFFVKVSDWEKIKVIFSNVNILILLLIVFLVVVRNAISSWRFQVLCEHHQPVSFLEINKHYFMASTFNLFMPTSIGGDALRVMLLERENIKKEIGLLLILTERFIGFFSFVLIALIGLLFIPFNTEITYMVVAINVIFLISSIILFSINIPQFKRFPIIEKLKTAFNMLRAEKETLIKVIFISLLFQLLSIYMRYLLAVAFGLEIGLVYFMVFIPLINLVTLLPISLGGVGLRESAFVYFFSQVGGVLDNEAALVLSISTYFILLTTGLIGLLIYFYESFFAKKILSNE